jgi:hypothetical protein
VDVATILSGYLMVRVGRLELSNDGWMFKAVVELAETDHWERAIYSIVVDDEIKRIGSFKGRIDGRFRAWSRRQPT